MPEHNRMASGWGMLNCHVTKQLTCLQYIVCHTTFESWHFGTSRAIRWAAKSVSLNVGQCVNMRGSSQTSASGRCDILKTLSAENIILLERVTGEQWAFTWLRSANGRRDQLVHGQRCRALEQKSCKRPTLVFLFPTFRLHLVVLRLRHA